MDDPATVQVRELDELEIALQRMGVGEGRPTLVLIGGASGLSEAEAARLTPLFVSLARMAERLDVAVVDGGTDVGVMRLLGRARAEAGASFPLVGVVPEALIARVGKPAGTDGAALEPHHSHFVFVPGDRWGDEVAWLGRVAELLARDRPSITLLVDGGEISVDDVAESVRLGRRVLVVDGTGRAADELAEALRVGGSSDRVGALAASGLVDAASLIDNSGIAVVEQVERTLVGAV
jgi:hypothetical protein